MLAQTGLAKTSLCIVEKSRYESTWTWSQVFTDRGRHTVEVDAQIEAEVDE